MKVIQLHIATAFLLIAGCSRNPYRMLVVTVIESATGTPTPGWHISVDHHLAGYSGPGLGEHFCQQFDNDEGEFRIVVAPTTRAGSSHPERLGIKIENTAADRCYYRAKFYVSREMWQDRSWKEPPCTDWWYENRDGKRGGGSVWGDKFRPLYRLVLRDAP